MRPENTMKCGISYSIVMVSTLNVLAQIALLVTALPCGRTNGSQWTTAIPGHQYYCHPLPLPPVHYLHHVLRIVRFEVARHLFVGQSFEPAGHVELLTLLTCLPFPLIIPVPVAGN